MDHGPNYYAPPVAPAPVIATAQVDATHVHYGKFAVRGGARLIDYIFEVILSAAGGFCAGILLVLMSGPHALATGAGGAASLVVSIGIGLVGNVAYFALGDGVGGATLGKLLLGLRVRQIDLAPCRLSSAIGRDLAFFIDSFFFGMIAYSAMQSSPREQRLGDKWANTVVVREASLPSEAPRPNPWFGIMLGSVARIAFGALAVFAQHV
jgi:uncharacterized RDD family membrane protein YckC